MRIIFMGSPSFAIPTLEALARHYEVVGVVTQPDRRAGRGRDLSSSAVKTWSLDHELPIIQPRRIKDEVHLEQLKAWKPDLIVVTAYGQIIPPEILNLTKLGCLNVHASLLPRWRGAAPIQAAILNGDLETGITIMRMDEGLDTGPILSQASTEIEVSETGGELAHRLSILGAALIIESLPLYLDGTLQPIPQDDEQATYAPMLKKADGEIDILKSAALLARQVRAYEPWPGSFMNWKGRRILIRQAYAISDQIGETGLISEVDGIPALSTAEGTLVMATLQTAGRNAISGEAFLRGAKDILGTILPPPQ
jgi:methionyl-tRNA formyltransferase